MLSIFGVGVGLEETVPPVYAPVIAVDWWYVEDRGELVDVLMVVQKLGN